MMTKAQFSNIIPQVWSAKLFQELRPMLGIAGLVKNDYEGEISSFGDTVKVRQFKNSARAQILTSDNEAYNDNVVEAALIELVVNKMAVFPVSVTDWVKYQADVNYQEEIRKIIAHEIARAIDTDILNTINPHASAGTVATMAKSYFAQAMRVLDEKLVPNDGTRACVLGTQYTEQMVQVNELLSRDFSSGSSVLLTGKVKDPLYGFNVYTSTLIGAKEALFFHPSFFQVAIQKGGDYKEMDLEASTNVMAKRVRGATLFGTKQFDSNRVYKIYN